MALIRAKNNVIQDFAEFKIPAEQVQQGHTITQISEHKEVLESWIFDGGYWLSSKKIRNFNLLDMTRDLKVPLSVEIHHNILLKSVKIDYLVDGRNNVTNYWIINLYRVDWDSNRVLITSTNTLSAALSSITIALDLQDRVDLNRTLGYQLELDERGTAGRLSLSGDLQYRHFLNHDFS